jgi:CheY-like chemotaxis protein
MATTCSPATALRILVLDDEPSIRSVYETGLVQFGCQVETASSGREALQILMQHSFDVLIVDIRMEGMSGIVFLQEAMKIWPWVGVIVVSGHVTSSVKQQANDLGVTRILHKPVTLKQLHENVLQESEERKLRDDDEVDANVLALMKDHLRLLSNPDQATVSTESLTNALLEFGKELATMLPSDVFGIMVVEQDEQAILLTAQTPVTEGFIASVRDEIIERYGVISDQGIDIKSEN